MNILELLQAWTHDVAAEKAIAMENLEAAGAAADDIAQAAESGHIEFSMFTGANGRPRQ